jgi:protein transport protein SEC31
MSWCPKDSELLLSSGKDSRTLCWNPQTGALLGEIARSTNWVFGTQWCPRNPDIFSSASFDGRISVSSFQALATGHAAPQASGSPGRAEDLFGAPASAGGEAAPPAPAKGSGARQIPKWLKRPIGATFGFGGRLALFSEGAPRRVSVVPLLARQAPGFATASLRLDAALSRDTLAEFCASKISRAVGSLHEKDPEAVFWSVAQALLEAEPQRRLLDLLGFDRAQLDTQLQDMGEAEEAEAEEAPVASPTSPLHFDGDEGGDGAAAAAAVFEQLSLGPPTRRGSVPFRLFGPEATETDRAVTRAVIMGDFPAAVDICMRADRLPDALLVALCGGPELLARTQEAYLQRARCRPYLRVVGAVLRRDLTDVVACGDLGSWEELLGIVCSFAGAGDFAPLCRILGARLEEQSHADASCVMPAIICSMAAGNAQHAAGLVIRLEEARLKQQHASLSYEAYGAWLESLVEKVRGVERAAASVHGPAGPLAEGVPGLPAKYLAYAVLMAEEGLLGIAARYFGAAGKAATEGGDAGALFGERLWNAAKGLGVALPRPTPFSIVNVVPEQAVPGGAGGGGDGAQAVPGGAAQAIPQATPQAMPLAMPQAVPPFAQQQQQQQPWAQPAAPPAPSAFSQPPAAPTAFSQPAYQPPLPPQQAPPATAFGWNPPAAPAPMAPAAAAAAAAPAMPSFPPTPSIPSVPHPMASAFATAPAAPQQQFTPYGQQFGAQVSPTELQPRAPAIPQPGVSFVGGSGSFSAGTLPHAQQSPLSSPAAAPLPPPKPIGGFNDAPMIAPRAPLAPAPAPIQAPAFQPTPTPQPAPQAPPSVVAASMASPTQPQASSPRALGPVDPAAIPPGSLPIHQTFSQLIAFCQARAVPVQRRIIEDSVKRLQFLFHQLAAGELSPLVHAELERMCQLIGQRNLDAALALHLPLMTAHFTEVGQWILAVKRLIEVAKTCPQ